MLLTVNDPVRGILTWQPAQTKAGGWLGQMTSVDKQMIDGWMEG